MKPWPSMTDILYLLVQNLAKLWANEHHEHHLQEFLLKKDPNALNVCVCERQHWGENTVKFTSPPLARARPFTHFCSERPWILFRVIEPRPPRKASFGWSLGCNPESLRILGHGYLYWRVARFLDHWTTPKFQSVCYLHNFTKQFSCTPDEVAFITICFGELRDPRVHS